MRTIAWLCAAGSFSVGLACPAGPGRAGLYVLRAESTFQQGCFPPCECPIMQEQPLHGTFRLQFVNSDSLFNHYAVTNIDWNVPSLNRYVTGSGTYRIGGEVAVTQQLSLDLQINGGPVTHFDSGVVGAPAGFPIIDAAISMHGMYCFDTVFSVVAAPCPSDWDASGDVTPSDVAAFITDWMASLTQGTLTADFDGNHAVQPSDVAAFVQSWFAAVSGDC